MKKQKTYKFCDEMQKVIDVMAEKPNMKIKKVRKSIIVLDEMIRGMKKDGSWDKIDGIYRFCLKEKKPYHILGLINFERYTRKVFKKYIKENFNITDYKEPALINWKILNNENLHTL